MKKSSKFLIIALIFILILFPIVSSAVTENEKNGIMLIDNSEELPLGDEEELEDSDEDINLDAKDVIGMAFEEDLKKGDIYLCENDVTLNDSVNGNAYIIANSVTINSEIIGNVFIMAKTINIGQDGYIDNSLYAL